MFLPWSRKGDGELNTAVPLLLFLCNYSQLIFTVWHVAWLNQPSVRPTVCTSMPRGDAGKVIPWFFAPISHVSACARIDYFQTLCNVKA